MGVGTIIPPFTSEDDEGYAFLWSHNPDPIPQGESQVFYIEGGVPPYTWSLTNGTLFSISTAVTSDQFNFIEADATAETDDEDTVTVEDADGNTVTGLCRCCLPHPCCPLAGDDRLFLQADDQAEGSTTFTDTSNGPNSPQTLSIAVGTPTITLVDFKFGVGSINSPGNCRLNVTGGADWDFGVGVDFIVDYWVNLTSKQNYAVVAARITGNIWWTGIHQGIPGFYSSSHGSIVYCTTDIFGAWAYVEWTRVSGQLYGFVNGVLELGPIAFNYNLSHATQTLALLHDNTSNSSLNGKLDEFRIVNGVGGHTANYTPPTSAHSPGGTIYPGYSQIAWDSENPSSIEAGSLEVYNVTGGCPPYQWTVTGNSGITWLKEWTARGVNVLVCDEDITSLDGVTAQVTDGCGLVATSGTISITFPPTGEECCPRAMIYDTESPDTVLRNSSSVVSIIGGCPPYQVQVSGTGFWLDAGYSTKTLITANSSFPIYADGTACGGTVISVLDSCNTGVSGYMRAPESGYWTQKSYECKIPGPGFIEDNKFKRIFGQYQNWETYIWSAASNECASPTDKCGITAFCDDAIECTTCLTGYEDCGVFAFAGICVDVTAMCVCIQVSCPYACSVCYCRNAGWLYEWVCW